MGIGDTFGRIGKVLDHNIKNIIEIITETRKGFNQKAVLYNSSGEDSPPIKNDKIILVKVDGTGKYIVIGTLTLSQGAKPGEKIFFARSESGEIKSKLSMLGDGSIELSGKVKTIDGYFECTGEVTPTGKGALCGCKFCYVTGDPVAGSKAEGT